MRRRVFLPLLSGAVYSQVVEPAEPPIEFICPMDPEVHSKQPGRCPRCGMRLEAGLPEPLEYRLLVDVLPKAPATTATVSLRLQVLHPKTGKRVEKFRLIHEKQFHLFLISEDLEYFAHEHPDFEPGGTFLFHTQLPKPGFYRILADLYPDGGTPQLLTATIRVRGREQPVAPLAAPNLQAVLRSEPEQPVAGLKTMLFFALTPWEGVEPWLGAWGHLLSASRDLLDLTHSHPVWEPYQNQVQFNVIFPRPGAYRLWGQFQRSGIVNTFRFDVRVKELG